MPATELAAKRYAQAAFELALEGGDIAAWSAALPRIADFLTSGETGAVFANTRVASDVKQRLLDAGLDDLPRLPRNLAALLVRKGRTALAPQIVEAFAELAASREGVTRAVAVTAVPLSDSERDALAQRLQASTGGRVDLVMEVDPSIIGGVVVQIGDRLIDGSTRARLQSLKQSLEGAVA